MSSLEILKKCVVHIAHRRTSGKYTKSLVVGTGFIVHSLAHENNNPRTVYIVTARRLIQSSQQERYDIVLQFNNRSGHSYWTPIIDSTRWIFPSDDSIDLALYPIPLRLEERDHLPYSLDSHYAAEQIYEQKIDVGDPVFLAGILHLHKWRTLGLSIVRTGNISAIPDDINASMRVTNIYEQHNPELTEHLRPISALQARNMYLIECRSISGMTGAPVFVRHIFDGTTRFSLLGMIQGRFRGANENYMDVTMADPLETDAVDSAFALVIPTTRIIEIFEQASIS